MTELQSYFINILDKKTSIAIVFKLIYENMKGKNKKIRIIIKR